MNPLKQIAFILIHFVLLAIILIYILVVDNKALEALLLAISIFFELSLLRFIKKINN